MCGKGASEWMNDGMGQQMSGKLYGVIMETAIKGRGKATENRDSTLTKER